MGLGLARGRPTNPARDTRRPKCWKSQHFGRLVSLEFGRSPACGDSHSDRKYGWKPGHSHRLANRSLDRFWQQTVGGAVIGWSGHRRQDIFVVQMVGGLRIGQLLLPWMRSGCRLGFREATATATDAAVQVFLGALQVSGIPARVRAASQVGSAGG
jgi:hypothetical protein